MTERSFFWAGISTGDAIYAPYSAQTLFQGVVWHVMHVRNAGEGYINGVLNELEPVLSGALATVKVKTGAALVNGTYYTTDEPVSVTIPTPVSNPRIDRIVLRKDWAAQTVRVFRIGGSEAASPTAPTLEQIPAIRWDVPIAQVLITTAGAMTVTDERETASSPLGNFGEMRLIEEHVATGAENAIVFNDIPQTYRSLLLKVTMLGTSPVGLGVDLFLNNQPNEPANYWRGGFFLDTAGPVVAAGVFNSAENMQARFDISDTLMWFSSETIISNYAKANHYKTWYQDDWNYVRDALTDIRLSATAGNFIENTDPITSIWLNTNLFGGQFMAGSTFQLYGII